MFVCYAWYIGFVDDATSLSAKLNSTLIVGKARASWLKEKRESCTVTLNRHTNISTPLIFKEPPLLLRRKMAESDSDQEMNNRILMTLNNEFYYPSHSDSSDDESMTDDPIAVE